MTRPQKPKVISLFSGAGGLDYGFEAAGFETAVALEMNHDCCETLRHNRDWPVIEASIFDVKSAELLRVAGAKPREIDVLIGGPPCQPFSKAGYWARGDALRLEDPRADTLSAYMRVLEDTLPRAFLLENVEGLAFDGKDEGLRLLYDHIDRINAKHRVSYSVSKAVLNACDYGVPQQRDRVFLVGHRDGQKFEFPEPTHFPPENAGKKERHRTAWDALADVEPSDTEDLALRGKWADLLPSIPEGSNYLHHTDRGDGIELFGWRRRYWTFLLKLAKNRPSWTIQAQPGPAIGPFHWNNRRLSMRELCRLQTFPDDVVVRGSLSAVQKQLGNAVPSLMAETLAREIRTQLLGMNRIKTAPKLLCAARADTPGPERRRQPHPKYLGLVGKHSAHPGTGKGYGAASRALMQSLRDD